MATVAALDLKIKAAGIPIFGVSYSSKTNPPTVRISFDPVATPQQRMQAQAIVDAYDWNAPDPVSADVQAVKDFLADPAPGTAQIVVALKALIRDRVR